MLMKKAGLIGGMSWESTVPYYKIINEVIGQQLGGLYSADCILHSINFYEIESTISKGNWDKSNELLANAAESLENAGADFIGICSLELLVIIPLHNSAKMISCTNCRSSKLGIIIFTPFL